MEAAEQRGVIYDTKVSAQSAINLIFVLPRKVSSRAKASTLRGAVVFRGGKNREKQILLLSSGFLNAGKQQKRSTYKLIN